MKKIIAIALVVVGAIAAAKRTGSDQPKDDQPKDVWEDATDKV